MAPSLQAGLPCSRIVRTFPCICVRPHPISRARHSQLYTSHDIAHIEGILKDSHIAKDQLLMPLFHEQVIECPQLHRINMCRLFPQLHRINLCRISPQLHRTNMCRLFLQVLRSQRSTLTTVLRLQTLLRLTSPLGHWLPTEKQSRQGNDPTYCPRAPDRSSSALLLLVSLLPSNGPLSKILLILSSTQGTVQLPH